MSEQKRPEMLTPLSITEKQRDFVAAQFHNLERDKALLLQSLALKDAAIADLSRQLAEARTQLIELGRPPSAPAEPLGTEDSDAATS